MIATRRRLDFDSGDGVEVGEVVVFCASCLILLRCIIGTPVNSISQVFVHYTPAMHNSKQQIESKVFCISLAIKAKA